MYPNLILNGQNGLLHLLSPLANRGPALLSHFIIPLGSRPVQARTPLKHACRGERGPTTLELSERVHVGAVIIRVDMSPSTASLREPDMIRSLRQFKRIGQDSHSQRDMVLADQTGSMIPTKGSYFTYGSFNIKGGL